MSEIKSQFFNGKTYSATDFVESNKNTMKDGILPNTDFFKVLPASNMTIGVTAGRGWVQGHAFSSDSTLAFTLDRADGVLDRVDTVIIRLDLTTDNEKIECKVIKGTLGGSATAPVRDGTYYDIVIAHITVARGTTAITAAMITDKRGDGNLCGWSGAISGDQFNFEELRQSKADKTCCDNTFATKTTLTAYQLTITNGTTKTNADRLQGIAISPAAATNGQALCSNGSQWAPKSLGAATLIASGSTDSYHINFSQSAVNFRYIYFVFTGGNDNSGTFESSAVGFLPTETLPSFQEDALIIYIMQSSPNGEGRRVVYFTSTMVGSGCGTVGYLPSSIKVWGVS